MVQWFNGTALKHMLDRNARAYMIPNLHVQSIAALNFQALSGDFKAIILDKDNCITRPYRDELEHPEAINSCVQCFGLDNVAVLSNCIGCEDISGGIDFGKRHKLHVIQHAVKKPGCIEAVRSHFKSLRLDQIVVVGDRLSTDILMARKHGMFGILVDPITLSGEYLAVILARYVERLVLRGHSNTGNEKYTI